LLEKLIKTSARPKTRLQALCVLDGLVASFRGTIRGVRDSHSGGRENAIRISEPWLKMIGSKNLAASLVPNQTSSASYFLKMVDDPAVRVRYQLAFTLGEWDDAASRASTRSWL